MGNEQITINKINYQESTITRGQAAGLWKFAKMPTEPRDIPIADNVLVPCPISGKQEKRLAHKCCPTCPNYFGLGMLIHADTPEEQATIDKMPFEKRYCIKCLTMAEWPLESFEI